MRVINGLTPVPVGTGMLYQPINVFQLRDRYPAMDYEQLSRCLTEGLDDKDFRLLDSHCIGQPISQIRINTDNCQYTNLTISFSSDFALSIKQGIFKTDFEETIERGDDWYILHVALCGGIKTTVDGCTVWERGASCSLNRYEEGVDFYQHVTPNLPHAFLDLSFRPSVVLKRMGISHQELDNILFSASSNSGIPHFIECSVTPAIKAVANELCSVSMDSARYRLFAESKALELLFHFITTMKEAAKDPWKLASKNQKGFLQLDKARKILAENYRNPPSIEMLSQTVGMSRSKLTNDFKSRYGKTVYEYIQGQRMERAMYLMQNEAFSIYTVAQEVGYTDPGSFSKVFRRHFGVLPSKTQMASNK